MTERQCSFCGKQQDPVKRLIAGPGVHICNECVELCREILEEDPAAQAGGQARGEATRVGASHERVVGILAKERLAEAVMQLSYRERRVVELRYGLGGRQPRTLDEVGAAFKLTRDQVRQIENQSLTKLRSPVDVPPDRGRS